ncbi:uncharacterized protein LOC136092052 [Hydra vulgaris]|uniref:Uncharacterized protein LOC136092052 n=1 Tax=Hydra vulgaris TaxID=6087 RepID=A0ABM4DMQ2_HYDVU
MRLTLLSALLFSSTNIILTPVSSTVNDLLDEPQNTVNRSSYPELCEVSSIINSDSDDAQNFINTLTNFGSSKKSQNSIKDPETFLSSTLNDQNLCFTDLNEKKELNNEEKVNKSNHKVKKGSIRILKRFCFICGKSFRRLSRYIAKKHKTNEKVKTALLKPKIERNRLFQCFKKDVIRDDPIGIIAKSDRTILMIWSLLYDKVRRKLSKKSEFQNSVRNDMRRLSHLYSHFKNYDVKPIYCNEAGMFFRQNFSSVMLAIEVYTDTYSENQKPGLKAALFYLVSSSAKKCMENFLAQDNDDSAKSISDFLVLLQLRKEEIFGDATYDLNERRNISLKKPSKLPIESDDLHAYVELRDAACTRIVLFNGRRGGEPARLLLRQCFEAAKDAWLDEQRAQDLTEINETNMKITYQSGKGSNHLVSVLIPEDTVRAIEILSYPVVRSNVGVLESNVYVFPSCQSSEKHCSGWHSLTNVCGKLPIINKSRLTGTTIRHRISTLMAAINLSEKSLVLNILVIAKI